MSENQKSFSVVTGRIPNEVKLQCDRNLVGRKDSYQSIILNAVTYFAEKGHDITSTEALSQPLNHNSASDNVIELDGAVVRWMKENQPETWELFRPQFELALEEMQKSAAHKDSKDRRKKTA